MVLILLLYYFLSVYFSIISFLRHVASCVGFGNDDSGSFCGSDIGSFGFGDGFGGSDSFDSVGLGHVDVLISFEVYLLFEWLYQIHHSHNFAIEQQPTYLKCRQLFVQVLQRLDK
jgi:hypothetical protein